jgi:5-methylcytosine-specific restriction enzyme A
MSGPSDKTRRLVYDRARELCERCGAYARGGAVHHRRPRGAGGTRRPETNLPANLMCLCEPCHLTIESRRDMARACGWLVRQTQDPKCVPVLTVHGWVFLDDEGGYLPVEVPA